MGFTHCAVPSQGASKALIAISLAIVVHGCQHSPVETETLNVKHVHVNGTEMSYVEQGRGTPVVFVHGSAGDWRIWENQRPAVSTRYRFIAYSRRYHSPNAAPTANTDYSMRVQVDDLVALIRTLSESPVHLVSTSYGAQLATVVAVEHPELVRSLTVGDPGFGSLVPDTAQGKAIAADFGRAFQGVREAATAVDAITAAERMVDVALGTRGAATALSARERQIISDNAATVGPQMMSTSRIGATCTQLASLKPPVLIVGGDASPPFFVMTNHEMARCIGAGASEIVVPNSRHLSHSMNPKFYNTALIQFLENH